MKKIHSLIITLLITYSSYAQLYKKHNWAETPIYEELLENEKAMPSVAIKEKHLIQYYGTFLGNSIKLFETTHSIIRINSDKGIATHNRVYIPMRNVKKVINIKARVLQKDGTIKNLNKNNIKELKNVKNYGSFKIFAIEGVTKDCQLEFIYTLQKYARSVGDIIVQKKYGVREAEVIIRKPSRLNLRIVEYNGFPVMKSKKVEGNRMAFTATAKNIDAMTNEGSGSPEANRMKLAYQVTSSYYTDEQMWENLKTNIQNTYIKIKPKKYKGITNNYKKFVKDKPKENSLDIVNNISEYIHSKYVIKRERDESLSDLKTIFKKKQASETGIIKIYTCLLNFENIDYKLVLTSNRFNHRFDRYFFSNLNLQIPLLYLVNEKKYIRPEYVNSRPNFAPMETISNFGIFIDAKKREFKRIEVPKPTQNIVFRNYIISIDSLDFSPKVSCTHNLTGYRAYYARSAYKYYKNKDFDYFKTFTGASGIEDVEFESFKVSKEDLTLGAKNIPINMSYTYKAESLIENVGNNNEFILNFGKVIGTQSEFYQEAKRVNPVDLRELIIYKYNIRIDIPKGYKIKNLESVKINKSKEIDAKLVCNFISDFKVEENSIVISVTETYNQLHMNLGFYENYKDVVNAAFDFSKKSLLFTKL